MKQFIISSNDAGQRLDKFLSKSVKQLPKNLMYKYIRLKRIKVNHRRSDISYQLQEGDLLELYINDEFFDSSPEMQFLSAPPLLNIVYEDENLLLVNKPSGLVVHEDDDGTQDTLIHRIQHYLYNKKEYLPDQELSFSPALCNRIDRNTCGIVIAAKNAETLRILNEKIKKRELKKKYLCIVTGIPNPQSATKKAYLVKDSVNNKVHLSSQPKPGSKEILTKYHVQAVRGNYSLLEVELLTGRTHQIRAHLAYLGYPILGDGKYGINREDRKKGYKYQALCSYQLKFLFSTDAGILNYLNRKEFTVKDIWFVDDFYSDKL